MEQNQQSTAEQYSEQIEQLMELGRTQGYLTYAEINDLLPEDLIDPEYYDKLLQTLQHDAGIPVLDEASSSSSSSAKGLTSFSANSRYILRTSRCSLDRWKSIVFCSFTIKIIGLSNFSQISSVTFIISCAFHFRKRNYHSFLEFVLFAEFIKVFLTFPFLL